MYFFPRVYSTAQLQYVFLHGTPISGLMAVGILGIFKGSWRVLV